MKRVFPILVIIISFILIGCAKKDEKPETTEKKTETTSQSPTTTTEKKPDANASTEEKKQSKEPEKKEELRDKSGAIRVKFPAGATEVTLNGSIKGFGDEPTYVFEVSKGQTLNAQVMGVKNKSANIRFVQIISPKGEGDGPFTDKIKYSLNESGDWKLIISENQRADDEWKGEYKLTISIK
jgi:hypothetical protein